MKTIKNITTQIQQAHPNSTDNQFLIETWKKLGLQDRIGGVAFSELKHFMDRSPNVESIGRLRRLVK